MLLGAGWSAEKIIRDILENPSTPYVIAGLLDDDESKSNTTIHGIPIYGKIETIHTFNIPFATNEFKTTLLIPVFFNTSDTTHFFLGYRAF